MKRSTGDKFTRIGMFRIPGRSNATNHETLIFSFILLYVTDQICEKTVIKAVPHRNVSAKKKKVRVTRISSQTMVKTDKIYYTSLHRRSFMNAVFWWLLKAAKVTAFVLGVPHRMIFMCFIPDNPSRGGNVMLINQAAIFVEIRDAEITRYDCYGVLKVGAFDCSRPNWTDICNVHMLPDPGTNRP